MTTALVYTRKQALEDGVLVDLTQFMEQHDMKMFKHPLACTTTVFEKTIEWNEKEDKVQSIAGRLWDVLTQALHAIKTNHNPSIDLVYFSVIVANKEGFREDVYLKMHIGPGDEGEPVMTIMMEDED